jgi:hypothetical protein
MLSYSDIQRFQKLVQSESGPEQAQLLQRGYEKNLLGYGISSNTSKRMQILKAIAVLITSLVHRFCILIGLLLISAMI